MRVTTLNWWNGRTLGLLRDVGTTSELHVPSASYIHLQRHALCTWPVRRSLCAVLVGVRLCVRAGVCAAVTERYTERQRERVSGPAADSAARTNISMFMDEISDAIRLVTDAVYSASVSHAGCCCCCCLHSQSQSIAVSSVVLVVCSERT